MIQHTGKSVFAATVQMRKAQHIQWLFHSRILKEIPLFWLYIYNMLKIHWNVKNNITCTQQTANFLKLLARKQLWTLHIVL